MFYKILVLIKGLFKPIPLDSNFIDYDEYWQNRGFHRPSLDRAKIISKHILVNSKILDIGCGDGTVIEYLNKNNRPKEIIGIDISKKAVDHVNNKGLLAYQLDIQSEDFVKFLDEKKFDYIIITEVLEHIQDPEKVINTIKKHFTKFIFVSIPNTGFFVHRVRLFLGRFPVVVIVQHIKEHIRFWTFNDFIYWCNYFGYKVDGYFVSPGSPFRLIRYIENFSPSLFANQIIYKISIKNENK